MVRSAVSLISTRGLSATSFSDVLSQSGAPRGSIYHHFPDGKRQLAEDAIRFASEHLLAQQRLAAAGSPSEILGKFIAMWRRVVTASSGASGCAVAGVTLDTSSDNDGLIDVAREAFRSWIALLAGQLNSAGVPSHRAKSIAIAALAAMEGALILCRAEGNSKPLDAVAEELMRLLPPETAHPKKRSRHKKA